MVHNRSSRSGRRGDFEPDVWILLTRHFITIYYFELYFSLTKHYMEVILSAKMKNVP